MYTQGTLLQTRAREGARQNRGPGRVGQFFELHEVKLVLPLSLVSDCAIDALPEVFGYGNKTQRAD